MIYISVSGNAFAVLNSFDFTQISVSIWVLDLDPLDDYYEPISAKLTDYGYVKAEWDIKRWYAAFCRFVIFLLLVILLAPFFCDLVE